MEKNILSVVYTVFVGFALALFIGLGISTFYPSPEAPTYPEVSETSRSAEDGTLTPAEQQYDREYREYSKLDQEYNRNVSIISIAAAVVFLVISLILSSRGSALAAGFMLGGLFTLLYGIIRGFVSEDSAYTFAAVTVSLVIVLYLGYRHFDGAKNNSVATKPKAKAKKRR